MRSGTSIGANCSEFPSAIFSETPEKITRGLIGANLPFVVQLTFNSIEVEVEESNTEIEKILFQMDDGVDDI